MAIEINSDADMPQCLNTSSKQAVRARQLAQAHSGIPAKKARGPRLQGFFSRTMIVTLQNGKEVVIQFRPEPLDFEPFLIARRALGTVVPNIEKVQDEELERLGIYVYCMTCIPGNTWLQGLRGKETKTRVTTIRSLGRIFAKAYVNNNSSVVVDHKLRPHLTLLLASEDVQVRQFHDVARDAASKLDQLKTLPLFISHFDLNEVNIMVDDNCEVSGIIDWELSTPLPLGVGFGRIHSLAGEFSNGKFHMPPEFEDSERGFWKELMEGMPEYVSNTVNANLGALQVAVVLGTLLDAFTLEHGQLAPYNPVTIEALPKLLSYRIPMIRGEAPPYFI